MLSKPVRPSFIFRTQITIFLMNTFCAQNPPQNNNFIQQFFSSGSVSTAIHESNTKHNTWTEEHADKWTRDRMLTIRDRTWSASVQTPTRNRNSRHECRDPNTTIKHNTRHADERAHGSGTLEAAHSQKTGHDGSVVPIQTHEWYQTKVTEPWHLRRMSCDLFTSRGMHMHELWYCRECTMENDPEEKKL